MPEITTPPELRDVDLETRAYILTGQPVEDATALALVTQTFEKYSTERYQNQDQRWADNDKLYHGVVPKRYWDDKKTKPRASLGVPIAFDQIWSAYPIITRELFGNNPFWFDVSPTQFSGAQEADAVRGALAYQLDTPWDNSCATTVDHAKLAILEILQHGNGVLEVGWNPARSRMFVEYVNLRDFYFSPMLTVPFIDSSPAVIRRQVVGVDEIIALEGVEGFNVPSKGVLNFFAKNRSADPSDDGKRFVASLVKENTNFLELMEADPSRQSVELLKYWTDDRMIWVINRQWVLTNRENPYGFKPFVMSPLYVVLGRGYAQSVPDLLEGEQLYIQGITNLRLDEVNLAINPPRARKKDGVQFPTNIGWYPGFVDTLGDAGDVTVQLPQNVTQRAYDEVALAEARARRRLGISDMIQGGVPTPSNANRTAGGVAAQGAAVSSRLSPIVENIENFLLVPLLYKAHRIISRFIPNFFPQVPALTEGGETQAVPREALGAPVRFKMQAASRMLTRDRLLQMSQMVLNVLLGEGFMGALQRQGQTVDFNEVTRFFGEATGTREKFNFFRPLTPEEQQALSQPSPDTQAEMQKAQLEAQTRLQMGQMKQQTETMKIQAEAKAAEDETVERSSRELLRMMSQEQIEALKAALARETAKMKKSAGGDD